LVGYLNTFKHHHHWRFHASRRNQWCFQNRNHHWRFPAAGQFATQQPNLGLRVHQVATTAGASKATSAKEEALQGMALPWPHGSSLSKAPSALAPCMASYVQNSTPWEISPKQP